MRPAVFLDRDGVLNDCWIDSRGVTRPPASLDDLVVSPGALEGCERLREAHLLLVMVTNQPDVARGQQTKEMVEAINAALVTSLGLDATMVCFHDSGDRCGCRKPAPGMLLKAAEDLGLDLAASYIVGDRPTDVAAGRAVGCSTVLLTAAGDGDADYVARDLAQAVDWILADIRVRA